MDLTITGTAAKACTNVASIAVRFTAGSSTNCLFKTEASDDFKLDPNSSDQHCSAESHVTGVNHEINVTSTNQGGDSKEFTISWAIITKAADNKPLSFGDNQYIKYTLSGTIAVAGNYVVSVEEQWNNDKGILTDVVT